RYVALAAIFLILPTERQTYADTLAGWSLSGVSSWGPDHFVPQTLSPDVTVDGWTHGSGFTFSGTAAGNAWGGTGLTTSSASAAISSGDFATFTITPKAGDTMSLDSFSPYNIRHSTTGPQNIQWQYSLDGSSFTDIGSPISVGSATSASGNPQGAIGLSGISALQNVPSTTTVTFRVAIWGATNVGGTWYFNGGGTNPSVNLLGSVTTAPPMGGNLTPATTSVSFPNQFVNNGATQSVTLNETAGAAVDYTSSLSGDALA